jgi:hypothetical protein
VEKVKKCSSSRSTPTSTKKKLPSLFSIPVRMTFLSTGILPIMIFTMSLSLSIVWMKWAGIRLLFGILGETEFIHSGKMIIEYYYAGEEVARSDSFDNDF